MVAYADERIVLCNVVWHAELIAEMVIDTWIPSKTFTLISSASRLFWADLTLLIRG
ncbi:hypothetical protein SynMVIR181_00238 [Synechococcus sp. MVIR-18-1]|nr:hypothetical protein SynMVIR181_00238 [Synechococcus sp. MVIR-18-1]